MILVDSDVLVAGLVRTHENHEPCRKWLEAGLDQRVRLAISQHAIAETYAVTTALPIVYRVPVQAASQLLHDLCDSAFVVGLQPKDYLTAISRLSAAGMEGAIMYDMLHLIAAEKCGANQILSGNRKDFSRLPTSHVLQVIPFSDRPQ